MAFRNLSMTALEDFGENQQKLERISIEQSKNILKYFSSKNKKNYVKP
jgi:hypothetical protein